MFKARGRLQGGSGMHANGSHAAPAGGSRRQGGHGSGQQRPHADPHAERRRRLMEAAAPPDDEEDDDMQEEEEEEPKEVAGDSAGEEEEEEGMDVGSSGDDEGGEGEEGEEGEEDAEDALQRKVADVPFEVLEALQQDGTGLQGFAARQAARAAEDKQRSMHRANRHRPAEMSSKKPVPRFREIIQVTKREAHDPRFETVGGGKSRKKGSGPGASHLGGSYAFVYDEVIPKEKKQLKDKLKREKNPKAQEHIKAQLSQLDQAMRGEEARRKKVKLAQAIKGAEKQAVASGKKPYYLKKSEQRRLELVAKYEELKKAGRLDKFMEKRRKKNAAKDHRYVPSQRRPEE